MKKPDSIVGQQAEKRQLAFDIETLEARRAALDAKPNKTQADYLDLKILPDRIQRVKCELETLERTLTALLKSQQQGLF